MRHRIAGKKLGRTSAHRAATTRNFIVAVITHERIETTLALAKGLRASVEKVVTLGRVKTLHRYRRALAKLQDKAAVAKLFNELGPRYASRAGGYTRIIRLSERRVGDGGAKAILELVDSSVLARKLAESTETEAT